MCYCKKIRVFFFLVIFVGCEGLLYNNNKVDAMDDAVFPVTEDVRKVLLHKSDYRVLFGHHSVGGNILDGLRAIALETGADYKIANLDTGRALSEVRIAEFNPGRNADPKSKIDGFVEQLINLPADFVPDAAFFKFCYVDFKPDTNIDELMAYYKEKMDVLKNRYPQIRFFHCTVPLTIWSTGLKSRIKRLFGIQVWSDASNISRTRFNNLLRETYPEGDVFDLARIESTRQDGTRTEFIYKGGTYPSLVPEYTNDGGHLNFLGGRIAATELVIFLNKLAHSSN